MEASKDDRSNYLSAYLKSEENSEVRVNQNISGEIVENIFTLAYKPQISKNVEKWQNYLPEKEKAKLSNNFIVENEDNGDDNKETYDLEIEKNITY